MQHNAATTDVIEELLEAYRTRSGGLAEADARLRLLRVGENRLPNPQRPNALLRFGAQFGNGLIAILVVATLVALAFGEFEQAIVLTLIILVNAAIGFSQEYHGEQSLRHLRKLIPQRARVWRDGHLSEKSRALLVPGDIVEIGPGDIVPADGKLIGSTDLMIDESALTGESTPAQKLVDPESLAGMVSMGTNVRNGNGQFLVTTTGSRTRFGAIALAVADTDKEQSQLITSLNQLAQKVTWIAAGLMAAVLIYGVVSGRDLAEQFIFALALAVSIVPEGLPATISVVLAIAAKRLANRRALVKNLSVVESLGAVTVICTDKTGTLTENELSVERIWLTHGKKAADLAFAGALCSNAHLDTDKERDLGDPLEIALARWSMSSPDRYQAHQGKYPRIRELTFNETDRLMSVIVKKNREPLLITKGAPEAVLERARLTELQRSTISKELIALSEKGYRVLAIAQKNLTTKDLKADRDELEQDLRIIGLVGFIDPPRPDVASAIGKARSAGLRILMLTGDNPRTATALARQIGILRANEGTVVTGDQMEGFDEAELRELLGRPAVFARITPIQKLRIVTTLQAMGEIVAVTGDGINDGPALKKADVGIAMGISGTDVARDTADMILLDDHFATIIAAIAEGRQLFTSLQNTIWYIFSANAGEIFTVIFGAIINLPLAPITALQILAIDLGTDILPSFALAADRTGQTLSLPPKPITNQSQLLPWKRLRELLPLGALIGLGGIISFLHVYWTEVSSTNLGHIYGQATMATYATIVLCQIVNTFASRSHTQSVFRLSYRYNPLLFAASGVAIIVLMAFIYLPVFQHALGGAAISQADWNLSLGYAFVFLIASELIKWNRRIEARAK